MAHINLLPWREDLRKERQRDFAIAAAGSAVLGVLAVLAVNMYFTDRTEYQKSRNMFLQNEIASSQKLVEEIKTLQSLKENLVARMDIIQQLQQSRPQIVHLFEELATTVPDGVNLASIDQAAAALTVNGSAQSNARVAAYMRNIESSDWISDPVLKIIENTDKATQSGSTFILQAVQSSPEAKKEALGVDLKSEVSGVDAQGSASGVAAKVEKE